MSDKTPRQLIEAEWNHSGATRSEAAERVIAGFQQREKELQERVRELERTKEVAAWKKEMEKEMERYPFTPKESASGLTMMLRDDKRLAREHYTRRLDAMVGILASAGKPWDITVGSAVGALAAIDAHVAEKFGEEG